MKLPIPLDLEPMEAALRDDLPEGKGWIYEPKWDGFRCLAYRDGPEVRLQSKAGKPLARYFPDIVEAILAIPARRFVLDGEIVVPVDGALSFDDLLQRIHPAESRVTKLAAETPGVYIAFDLLLGERGTTRLNQPLKTRRARLEVFGAKRLKSDDRVRISPATEDVETARGWLDEGHGGLDGVIAKRGDLPYQSGNREGMVKVKRMRSADCVVGGFRWSKTRGRVASLLLGLYDAEGKLHHVGFCSSFDAKRRKEVDERVPSLRGGEGFTGRAPGGPSRWRKEGSGDWEPLPAVLVVEVQYDHFTAGRFRHGTRFLRWRPDKSPASCTLDQLGEPGPEFEL
jgi:ATP-dependent DNA ligase